MHKIQSALAISLAALVLSTSLASAVSTLPSTDTPMTTPNTPIVNNGDFGHHFDAADYFSQDFIDRQPLTVKQPPSQAVSQLSCGFMNYNDDGLSLGLTFKNTGDTVIPAGSKFVIVMPNGEAKVFVVEVAIQPDWGMGIKDLFEGAFPENWTCQVAFISA